MLEHYSKSLVWNSTSPQEIISGHNCASSYESLGLLDYYNRSDQKAKQKTYKSSGQKQKYILTLTLTEVSLKSMCFHTATYNRSFLSFCDRDGRQRRIPSGLFWQIEWRELHLLFSERLPCGNRVRPLTKNEINEWNSPYLLYGSGLFCC